MAARLAVRLAMSQLRRSPAVLLLASLTVASLVLLAGLAADHAVSARNARSRARFTVQAVHVHSDGTRHLHDNQPISSGVTYQILGDRQLALIASWASPQEPPVLPGLSRNPGPGELFVSPAVHEQLRQGPEREELRAWLPGQIVGTLPASALLAPGELAAVVGYDRAEVPPPTDWSPGEGPAGPSHLLIAVAMVLVVVPSLLLVAVAVRFNARRRSRRTATLRMLGASSRDLALFAVVEAALLGIPAVVLAMLVGFALRGFAVTQVFGDAVFRPADLRPSVASLVAVVLLVPLLAAAVTVLSARLILDNPLEAVHGITTRRLQAWRLFPLGAGIGLFLLGTAAWRSLPESALAATELAGILLTLVGLAVAGPLLAQWAAVRLAGRRGGGGASLVALRRLQHDPHAAFRTVSGLALAAFVFGFIASLDLAGTSSQRSADDAPFWIELNGQALLPIWRELQRAPGVAEAAPVAHLQTSAGYAMLTTCDGVTRIQGIRIISGVCREGELLAVTPRSNLQPGQRLPRLQIEGAQSRTLTLPQVSGVVDEGDVGKVDIVLALTPQRFDALDEVAASRVIVRTGGDQVTELATFAAVARGAPLALVGRPGELGATRLYAVVWNALLRLALLGALAVALASLMVAVAEALLDRRRALALLAALGMEPADARRLTAVEVTLPVSVAVIPALAVGVAMSWTGATLLSGDTRAPWSEVLWASGATLLVTGLSFLALMSLVRRLPAFEVLRRDP